jgi:hypothetical protein
MMTLLYLLMKAKKWLMQSTKMAAMPSLPYIKTVDMMHGHKLMQTEMFLIGFYLTKGQVIWNLDTKLTIFKYTDKE